jgi:hypothetical protein
MVTIVSNIYGLNILVASKNGKLIKNENVYNLIMSFFFKATRIKYFIVNCIKINEEAKILIFDKQLQFHQKKSTEFFGITKKFRLN